MKSSVFDADTVRALASVLADTGLTEVELCDGDRRIRLSRALAASSQAPAAPSALAAAPAPVIAPDAEHPGAVTSPMVGIAYLSPEPGTPPFVTTGATVAAGQTVMLIEAMKTFNQIKAPRSGTVTRILIRSGVPVEYGEALLVIE